MTIERMLWFDEQVRAGRHPGSGTLAAYFKVSLRTAQRDIEFLRNRLQAPLKYFACEKGFAYEDAGFFLPSSFFKKEELIALLIAGKLFEEIRPPLKEELEGISARLAELFKVPLLEKIREAVSFEVTRGIETPGKVFFDLLRAATQRKVVLLRWSRASDSEAVEREVEPLRLHFFPGNWYLVWVSGRRKGIGFHPLRGITGVEVTGRNFIPRKSASEVDAFLRRGAGGFREGKVRDARIRILPRKAAIASKIELHPRQRLQFELDGSVVLEIPDARFMEILGFVLQQGSDAAVISPKELREAVHAEVNRLGAIYRV
jgi:predicted DNA-binding transcriptional regulator YafY